MDVTVGWCTEFRPRILGGRLIQACRPPILFQSHLGRHLAVTGVALTGRAVLDEDLGVDLIAATAEAAIAQADIAYLSSHGRMVGTTYRFRLRKGEWTPTQSPARLPAVLVLDTCDVVKKDVLPHKSGWVHAGRPSPALVLGFVGPASDGYDASKRGRVFAEHLVLGRSYTDAWFRAVADTQPPSRRDRAIAMAFGPDANAAKATLWSASLANHPGTTVADACAWNMR